MRLFLIGWLALCALPCRAQPFDYTLVPREVAPQVYVFRGADADFSRENGGNIANTGFIVAPDGVIVIDSGPSHRYGQAQRAAIRAATGKEVAVVLITHAHPDHLLGNTAYADVPIRALPGTAREIGQDGGKLAENLYRLLGGWMSGSVALAPQPLPATGTVQIAGRTLQLLALEGHTGADLAVLDADSGVLFAGDLVFLERTPTTPHADLVRWDEALDRLAELSWRVVVPGHGPVHGDASGIVQTRDYLRWLDATLIDAAERGLETNEVMALPAPERFGTLPVFGSEFMRSVIHLYPAVETRSLPPASLSP